ncbi:hypothetical protein TW95_gp1149 [Pandoravirus inopinatum]|uniref:Uncharacterized protein n=1 Tax=Pandoravirus inopinatum TaxID=1605721 RepID=A0A0B5IYE3_9VIRU|nr:hypothetical protein TW95_gp1149 [Pandoravirus inopinatum]AJF97883.1 hypothetical protein [Pandoravirus inopinatum]
MLGGARPIVRQPVFFVCAARRKSWPIGAASWPAFLFFLNPINNVSLLLWVSTSTAAFFFPASLSFRTGKRHGAGRQPAGHLFFFVGPSRPRQCCAQHGDQTTSTFFTKGHTNRRKTRL